MDSNIATNICKFCSFFHPGLLKQEHIPLLQKQRPEKTARFLGRVVLISYMNPYQLYPLESVIIVANHILPLQKYLYQLNHITYPTMIRPLHVKNK